MPYSGNSWQQLLVGLFEVVQCRGAAISQIPVLANFRFADHPGVIAWWLESKM